MPGNNLQAKLFLAVAGGDPPDIVNQDDPVLADWAKHGVIQPLNKVVDASDVDAVTRSLLAPARKLSVVDGELFAICNGLDIRALLYNQTAIESAGLSVPETIKQLDAIASHFAPTSADTPTKRLSSPVGYLPDSRRLWAWAPVFGASFYDPQTHQVTLNSPSAQSALEWMAGYGRRYGADNLAAFRQGDQSLPGKTFPLLPVDDEAVVGRYVVMMDGQWRVRDISAFQQRRAAQNLPTIDFGVCPLPFVDGDSKNQQPQLTQPTQSPAIKDAGWVNGNFFVVPSGAKCSDGAWEFAKFWIGQSQYNDPDTAAKWYAQGGWIPVTQAVAASKPYQNYLAENPLMKTFVRLAGSANQHPIPAIPGAAILKRAVENLTYDAMMNDHHSDNVGDLLRQRSAEIKLQLNVIKD
jgi:multiple sugar transport system substrate-binding protein